jgi:CheY-like chemotaxis protein
MNMDRIHILVVDDVADAADTMVELLSIWGYDAVACYDGTAALEAARFRRPDAVVLDLAMPLMDGFQFAELLHELPDCGSVPIIAVSGYSFPVYATRARGVGIRHYLVKPADPTRLKKLLVQELDPFAPPSPLFGDSIGCLPLGLPQLSRRVPGGVESQPRSVPVI